VVAALFLSSEPVGCDAAYIGRMFVKRDHRGFTLIELLIVVVILGILVSIVVPKFANGKERAMVAAMKTDLRNLMSAEEAFFSNGFNYYAGAIPDPAMPYSPSENVTVTLSNVTASGWAAEATHGSTARTCDVFVGTAASVGHATVEGEVACTQ
jgi:prepilin-type N-terminal cleavage/methylation domain-containing protein